MLRMTPASSAATTKASGAAAATCAGWYGGVDNVDKYIAGCSARESGNKIFVLLLHFHHHKLCQRVKVSEVVVMYVHCNCAV